MGADWQDAYRPGGAGRGGGSGSWWERMKGRRKPLLITALLVGGLAFAAGWNPPTTTVHSFTEASDYSERRQSGCTNSGDGCHGSDERLADFNRYHPDTDCKTCHEYTGVGCIPCHGPQQHECAGCHDGTMEGASDCVRLSDPYPKGHYRASLHTATGTDMDRAVLAAAGGTAKATCADCHSDDLAAAHTDVPEVEGSTYGTEIGCGECHNDEQSGALDEVLGDWKQHRCEDCHGERVRAAMHAVDVAAPVEASGEAGCGATGQGCHDVNDLHALHPDAPATCSGSAAEGEPGCHDLGRQAHAPETTGCGTGEGTCHAPYVNDDLGHKRDAEVHDAGAQASATLRDEASGVSATCGSCHAGDLTDEHSRAHVSLGQNRCTGCHNDSERTVSAVKDSWPARGTASACAACHAASPHGDLAAPHQAEQIAYDGTRSATGCARPGCHPTADVRVLHAELGCALAGCHSRAGSIAGSRMTCGGTDDATACHTSSDKKKHAGFETAHVAVEYDRNNVPTPASCVKSGCHSTTNVAEQHHDVGCALSGCHVQGGPVGPMGCGGTDPALSCHLRGVSYHTKNANHHVAVEYDRNNVATPGSCVKSGCHTTTRMSTLHEDAGGCYGTAGCHVQGGPSMVIGCGGTDPALSCHLRGVSYHTKNPNHHIAVEYDDAGAAAPGTCTTGTGCHTTTRMSTLHEDAGGCYGTAGCHVQGGPSMVIGCGGPDAETSCHVRGTFHTAAYASHEMTELDDTGVPTPGSCVRAGCHTTTNTYDLHTSGGCANWGCHIDGGLVRTSCGGPTGLPTACHQVGYRHADYATVHVFTEINHLGEVEPGACATPGCHPSNDVTVVHAEATPEGGCNVWGCHFEGGLQRTSCGGTNETVGACHQGSYRHDTFYADHIGAETAPGTCVTGGCHTTLMQYELHHDLGCTIAGCHTTTSVRPTPMTCGGDGTTPGACHSPSPACPAIGSTAVPAEPPAEGTVIWRDFHGTDGPAAPDKEAPSPPASAETTGSTE